eukprot:4739996-Prymnesium_polylepis.1
MKRRLVHEAAWCEVNQAPPSTSTTDCPLFPGLSRLSNLLCGCGCGGDCESIRGVMRAVIAGAGGAQS